MDILLDIDLFKSFIHGQGHTLPEDRTRLINNILSNKQNKFLFNKQFGDLISNEYAKDIKKDLAQQFITNLISENRIINLKNTNSASCYNDLKSDFLINYKNHLKKGELFSILSKSVCKNNLPNEAFLNDVNKPNRSWLYFNLAAYHPNTLTVRFYDFKQNGDIIDFMDSLYNLNTNLKIVWVFDRYRNLNHNLLNSLIGKAKFHYLTFIHKDDQKVGVNLIVKKFKSALTFTSKPENIHERRIIIDSLIIEFDEDFANIDINRNTWKIDITYCNDSSTNILKKVTNFKRIIQ